MGRFVSYSDGDQRLEGYLASPLSGTRLPGVVLAPAWLNVSESMCHRADRLAALGFAAFVLDVFGAGVRPGPPQHPRDVVTLLMTDRLLFRRRLSAGVQALRLQPECLGEEVAAVGYCLGGCGVLELARSGAPLRGVVSLHGELGSPLPAQAGEIKAKVLVLHGDADPLVSFESVVAFREEMRRAGADWQITLYSNAKHSFTGEGSIPGRTPEAVLHPQADARSWQSTVEFLREVLKPK
jgi:dienelactone hydrolase